MSQFFKTADLLNLHFYPSSEEQIYVNGGKAGNFLFEARKLIYELYSLDTYLVNFYVVYGRVYRRKIIDNKKVVYESETEEILDLPESFLNTLFPYYPLGVDSDVYSANLKDTPKKFKKSLAVLNVKEKSIVHKPISASYPCILDGYVYFIERRTRDVYKYDLKLKQLWLFKPYCSATSALPIKKYFNTVLVFIGPEKEERNLVNGHARYTCSGGKLYGLNDADGAVAWQLEMPNSMDGYELVDDTLYAVSLNEILLINPETGDIKHTIDTKTSTPFNRDLKPTITIDDKFIYYTHYDDAVILVYDVNTLQFVRRIDMPEGYYPKEHNFHDVNTGKQYFTIHNKTQYVAQWPVLEIDPNDIDSPVEFEAEPEIRIELLPAKGNDQEIEVVIKLQSESLDDALRFGEIYTRDEAQRYSHNYMNMTFMDRPFAPEKRFNGIVRFIYSGSKEDEIKVKEHLEIMEKRFQNWNEKEGFFACTNKKQPTRLIAEYVGGGGIRSL